MLSACSGCSPVGNAELRSKAAILSSPSPPFVQVLAITVFAIHPPAEVRTELAVDPLEEFEIALAAQRLFDPIEKDRGPAMHRLIDVAEMPLVGRDLSDRMPEQPEEQQVELLLGEIDIDGGERDCVKGQVPGSEPRIFRFVRHRDDIVADQVEPLAVPHLAGWSHRVDAMFVEPFVNIEAEVLFAPQPAG